MKKFITGFIGELSEAIAAYFLFKWFFTPIFNAKLDIAQIFGLQMLVRHFIFPEKLLDSVVEVKTRSTQMKITLNVILLFFGWVLYCAHMNAFAY